MTGRDAGGPRGLPVGEVVYEIVMSCQEKIEAVKQCDLLYRFLGVD